MIKHFIRKSLFIIALLLFYSLSLNAKEVLWVSYNVENLFDDEMTGTEYNEIKTYWNKHAYQTRMLSLAKVFDKAIGKKKAVELVALQEIENENALADLCRKSKVLGKLKHREFVKGEGQGIGLALLSKYPIISTTSYHNSLFGSDSKAIRPIIYATLQVKKDVVAHVFVVHLPSKYQETKTKKDNRQKMLDFLQSKAQKILAKDTSAYVVVMGDFNEEKSHRTIKSLINGYTLSPKEKGSTVYKKRWTKIDQILFSSYFSNAKSPLKITNFDVVNNAFLLRTKDGMKVPRDLYKGSGYSDHLPVAIEVSY